MSFTFSQIYVCALYKSLSIIHLIYSIIEYE